MIMTDEVSKSHTNKESLYSPFSIFSSSTPIRSLLTFVKSARCDETRQDIIADTNSMLETHFHSCIFHSRLYARIEWEAKSTCEANTPKDAQRVI